MGPVHGREVGKSLMQSDICRPVEERAEAVAWLA